MVETCFNSENGLQIKELTAVRGDQPLAVNGPKTVHVGRDNGSLYFGSLIIDWQRSITVYIPTWNPKQPERNGCFRKQPFPM